MSEQTVQVGDYFVASWGYDQTNIDYYKVVAVTPSGKSVRVQQWSTKVERDEGPQVYLLPGDGPAQTYARQPEGGGFVRDDNGEPVVIDAPVELYRLQRGGRPAIRLTSYKYGFAWDGRPKAATGSGWGH